MDNVRNMTGSPIAGIDPHEFLDVRQLDKREPNPCQMSMYLLQFPFASPLAGSCSLLTDVLCDCLHHQQDDLLM